MILKQSFHQWLYDQEFKLKNGRTICIDGIYRVVTEEYLDPWTDEFYLEYRILMANGEIIIADKDDVKSLQFKLIDWAQRAIKILS